MERNQNKMSSDEMNVIWRKDKLQKFSKMGTYKAHTRTNGKFLLCSKESLISPIVASGDGCGELHCRLCGASDHLQLITNDRLDETLRLYFGVQVPPEGVICESCIKCMKITEGFSALVHASFDKTVSEDSSKHTRILAAFSPGTTNLPATNPQKEILSLLNTKLSLEAPRKRRETRRKIVTKTSSNIVFKKIIIPCTVCGQRYPLIMPVGGVKVFVCSRCQKHDTSRDCKKRSTLSSVNKIDLRCKIDLKGKSRLNNQPKTPQQVKQNLSATKYDFLGKHQCSQCPKKYAIEENLATHIKTVHEGSSHFICSVCGKKMKSKAILEKHLREHTGVKIFQCTQTECMRIFKSHRALQTHCSMAHENHKNISFSS